MFVIREEQLNAFREPAIRDAALVLADSLRQTDGAFVAHLSNEALKATARAGVRRALTYRITRPAALSDFVLAAIRFGPDFDRRPGVRALLLDEKLPQETRLYSSFKLLETTAAK